MKKKDNKVPFSNYVKLVLIVLATVFIVMLFRNWYVSGRDYELNIPIIKETLISEINTTEVYNYVRENENTILYIGVVNNEECRNFEKEFNEVIRRRTLEDTITYLNISKEKNKSKFIKELNKFYGTDLKGYPSIIIFEEGEVKATISVKTGKSLNINDVEKFLNDNNVVSESL